MSKAQRYKQHQSEKSKQSRVRLVRKDVTLLQLSRSTKDSTLKWLLDLLDGKTHLTDDDLATLPLSRRKEFELSIDRIVNTARLEWMGDDTLGVEPFEYRKVPLNCSLCNAKNNWIYHIINKFTGFRINVGRECFHSFGIEDGMEEADRRRAIKDHKKTARIVAINKQIEGISNTVERLRRKTMQYPILVPFDVERPYLLIGERVSRIYYDYIEGKSVELDEIPLLLKSLDDEQVKINEYVEQNKNKENVVKLGLVEWLEERQEHHTLQLLKQNGFITKETAYRIYRKDFLNSLIDSYNKRIEGVTFESAVESKRGFVISFEDILFVKLLCKHNEFTNRYGEIHFGDYSGELPSKEEILKMTDILEEHAEYLYYEIIQRSGKYPFSFPIFNMKTNEIVIYSRVKRMYAIVDLKSFLNQFKHLIFFKDRFESFELKKYLEQVKYNWKIVDMRDVFKDRGWNYSNMPDEEEEE